MTRTTAPRPGQRPTRAFTLVELLVSMTVLSVIVLLISQLFSSATSVATSSRKRLDADASARLVFDRMAVDFSKMLKRSDVDYLFAKVSPPANGAQSQNDARNDAMFFYSEAPAFYDGSDATTGTPTPNLRSSVALIGYRINKAYQLERLGKQLTWDESGSNTPGAITYLMPEGTPVPSATPKDINIPDFRSTLAGHWPDVIGKASDSPAAYTETKDDLDFQVLAEQVCRLEICFQLKDGTFSPLPVCPLATATLPALPNGSLPSDSIRYDITGPTKLADSSAKYVIGYRWFDTKGGRGYVCTDNTAGNAVWKSLGMQDVRAVVVALVILDSTSSRSVRSTPVKMDNRTFDVPKLDVLSGIFADADPNDVMPGVVPSTSSIVPSFPTPVPLISPIPASTPLPSPARLMAEAWNNEIRGTSDRASTFVKDSGLPGPVAAQVRVYQRSFVLNYQ